MRLALLAILLLSCLRVDREDLADELLVCVCLFLHRETLVGFLV
jgi:hypothetical protein